MDTLILSPSDNVQAALNSIVKPTLIKLKSGVYRQKLLISASNVIIEGEGQGATIISYNDYAHKKHADGKEYGTFRTYTVCVTGDNVVIKNLTVENSAIGNDCGQRVALFVNATKFTAENVDIKSQKDTLCCGPIPDDLAVRYAGLTDDSPYGEGYMPASQLFFEGPALQRFYSCRIVGSVDIIFGCARAFFKDCEIISIKDACKTGFVAAPAHPLCEKFGFSFLDCNFICGNADKNSCYLARPWRDFGKCNFINCRIESHIVPTLFDRWNNSYRNKTARFGYRNLSCEFFADPAEWSGELSSAQAEEILIEFKRQ